MKYNWIREAGTSTEIVCSRTVFGSPTRQGFHFSDPFAKSSAILPGVQMLANPRGLIYVHSQGMVHGDLKGVCS